MRGGRRGEDAGAADDEPVDAVGGAHGHDDVDDLFAQVTAVPAQHQRAAAQLSAQSGRQQALDKILRVVLRRSRRSNKRN